jgi:periplasmic protein TonB
VKRLLIPLSMALLIHFVLLYLPMGPKFAAPAHRRTRQTISLSLFKVPSPQKADEPKAQRRSTSSQPKLKPPVQKKLKPVIEQNPIPIPIPRLEPKVKDSSASLPKLTPEPREIPEKREISVKERIINPQPTKIEPERDLKTVASRSESLSTKSVSSNKPEDDVDLKQSPAQKKIQAPVIEPLTKAVPLYRKNPTPVYPTSARRRRNQGTVILAVLIDIEGKVGEIRVEKSSGYTALDRSALRSVGSWAFVPGKKGDQPIDMWVHVPIRFSLK